MSATLPSLSHDGHWAGAIVPGLAEKLLRDVRQCQASTGDQFVTFELLLRRGSEASNYRTR